MPFFDQNPLEQLATATEDADETLDLTALDDTKALAAVERLLHTGDTSNSYLIRFAAARNDGRETLFLPLGRRLLKARRDGVLRHCLPTPDGTGYLIAFREHD